MTGLHHQPPLTFPHLPQQRTRSPSPHQVFGLNLPQFHSLPLLQNCLWMCGYPSTSWMEKDSLVSENELHLNPNSSGFQEQRISGFCPSFQLSLLPMPPSTSAIPLWVDALLTSSAVCIITPFWFPIRDSLQASYPLLDVIGHSLSLRASCFSLWLPWPSCLHFLLYHSPSDGVVTFLYILPQTSICADLLAQLNGPPKPNSMFLALQ